MLKVVFLSAALLLSTAAQAEEARALLDRAVAVADAHKANRYAFTLLYRDIKAEPKDPYVLRFDPRRPEGERWSLLEPAESALSKDERRRLGNLRKTNDADGALIYDGLALSAREARLVSEDEATATFAAPVRDEETPDAIAKAVDLSIVLDKKGGFIRSIALQSTKPFKPAPVAKIERMVQTQTFGAPHAGGPALLARSESIAAGEALFKKFDRHGVMEYRDIEEVAADSVAGAAGGATR